MNYTHYDFLELAPGAEPARVEAAYVSLLERMSFGASDSGQDLSGLVRRIHAAYDVLADPEQREAYDTWLAAEAERADLELKSMLDSPGARAARRVQDVPPPLAAAFAPLAA
ncbi:MAG: DnaJ domain-containing protein [Betaproteobacteria bacterium]